MLDAIQATSVDTIGRVREIRNELDRTVDEVRAALPRIYTEELVETLFVHPYSKTEFLVNALGVERKEEFYAEPLPQPKPLDEAPPNSVSFT